jgi:hypothetical protein
MFHSSLAKWALLALLFLVTSCDQKSTLIYEGQNAIVRATSSGIKEADEIQWGVGALRKQTVSKGFRLKIDFPLLEEEDLVRIVKEKSVAAWLVRIKRVRNGNPEVLGYVTIPLTSAMARGGEKRKPQQLKSAYLNIYYAAAALSRRFENFECPAFDHKKRIGDVEEVLEPTRSALLILSQSEAKQVTVRSEPLGYAPVVINGGMELDGEYIIELAFYNDEEKRQLSNFIELAASIKILNEETVNLKGCQNFQIPPRDENEEAKYREFKFGR